MRFSSAVASPPTVDQVTQALAKVNDPEIHRPITELGMVKNVDVSADGTVRVDVWLTVAGCPLRDTITRGATAAVAGLAGGWAGAARRIAGAGRARRDEQRAAPGPAGQRARGQGGARDPVRQSFVAD